MILLREKHDGIVFSILPDVVTKLTCVCAYVVGIVKLFICRTLSLMDMWIRLLLKAGCRWDENCTKWVENLLFEVILMAFSSVCRPETWRTRLFHPKTLSGDQEWWFFRKLSSNLQRTFKKSLEQCTKLLTRCRLGIMAVGSINNNIITRPGPG